MNSFQQSAFTKYIESIQNPEIIKIVGQQLLREGIIQSSATFGGANSTIKENISDLITSTNREEDTATNMGNVFVGIGRQLLERKTTQERTLKSNFNQLLVALLIGIVLIPIGYFLNLQIFLMVGMSSILFVFGLLLYTKYNNSFQQLLLIDRELNRLNFISAKFELVERIQNLELRKEASKYLVQDLASPSINVNNSIENMIYGSSIQSGGDIQVGNRTSNN